MKALAVISTDWHIKQNNTTTILGLVDQQIKLARESGTDQLICLGDVFDSRISQREEVLNTFSSILDRLRQENMHMICIPGNHDKTVYSSENSFLLPFKDHPNLRLISQPEVLTLGKLRCLFIPFFEIEAWLRKFWATTKVEQNINVLFSHVAVNGSVNNDGSKVENGITAKLLSPFDYVYLGHYHNAQQVFDNTFHLPSIQQNNFGEDQAKGFSILLEDGSIDFVESEFKKYFTLKYDLSQTEAETITMDILRPEFKDQNVRVEILGSESELKGINDDLFADDGIILRKRRKEVETDISREIKEIRISGDSIEKLFTDFCQQKSYDKALGMKYLQKYIAKV